MKYLLIGLLIVELRVFGQSIPDQKIIPEYVLVGKTAPELRLMRNEIFARYGHIFKSEELRNWFEKKIWYNPIKNNVESLLTDVDKTNISLILEYEKKNENIKFEINSSELNEAYYRVFNDTQSNIKIKKSREISFEQHCEFGTIKKTVERTNIGQESTPTVIYAETIEPKKTFWFTTKYFNDLGFSCKYYKATNYGCCGSEEYNELFKYGNEEAFLTFNKKYFVVDIPNSKIDMFIGYKHHRKDTASMRFADLYLSTLDGVVSSISFELKNPQEFDDLIWYFTPKIELRTHINENRIINNGHEIRLWSSRMAQTTSEVDGFFIHIEFVGDNTSKKAIYDIPIKNGKFFGLPKKNTNVIIELK